jgi:hypothetical protein
MYSWRKHLNRKDLMWELGSFLHRSLLCQYVLTWVPPTLVKNWCIQTTSGSRDVQG